MSQGKTIAIAGNIGSGKSSLVEFLSQAYDIRPFYEPNDENPYLPDFYRDMKAWAFHSQLYFLSNKFRLHQELDQTAGVVVLDRTIFEDAEIFATALKQMRKFNGRDWDTYWNFYQIILNFHEFQDNEGIQEGDIVELMNYFYGNHNGNVDLL